MTMNGYQDAPPELRLIVRKYSQRSYLPAGENPSLCLQNYNTSRLQSGAVAMVTHNFGATLFDTKRVFYVFDKEYAGAVVNDQYALTPLAGGGIWVMVKDGSYIGNEDAIGPAAPVTLTAAAPEATIYTFTDGVDSYMWRRLSITATVIVTATTIGAVPVIGMDYSSYLPPAAPVWTAVAADKSITMLANQQAMLTLVPANVVLVRPGYTLGIRVVGLTTVQDVVIPANGVSISALAFGDTYQV
jgi:hypothetical protein